MIKIVGHKLRFALFGWRLYKVTQYKNPKPYYLLTNHRLPKYKYKSVLIHADLKPIRNNLYIWREQ